MSPLTVRIEQALFGHRGGVLTTFALVTLVMAWLAIGLRVEAGFSKQVPLEHPYMQTYLEHRAEFGDADRVVIALMTRSGDMFTPEFFAALRRVTDAVFFLPGVDRTQVYSLLTPNVRFTEVIEDGIAGGNVVPADFRPTPAGLARVRENAIKAALVGRLVANDFTGAIISARLQEFHPDTGARLDYVQVANELERIRVEVQSTTDLDVHIIGFAKVVGDIAASSSRMAVLFAATLLIATFIAYLYAGSVRLAATPIVCSLAAVIWQLGAVSGLDLGIDPFSILVPFLVFAIGVSHGMQMVGAVRAEVLDGASDHDAARASFRRLLVPGVVALASDSVGFISISFIEVRIIQEMAIAASLGVAAIILTNLIVVPLLLSYNETREAARRAAYRRRRLLCGWWRLLAHTGRRGPAAVTIGVSALLMLVGLRFALEVQVGDLHRGVPELRPDATYNRDVEAIAARFHVGVDVFTVLVETAAQGCVDYSIMDIIDRFEWHMRNVEGVQSVLGLPGVARTNHSGWNEGSLKWRVLPRHPSSLAQAVAYVPTSSGLLNADCSVMPVRIFTTDHTAKTINRVVTAAKAFHSPNAAQGIDFRLAAGNVGVMAATNEEVAASQFPILGYVFAAVIGLCLLAFRSLRTTTCIVVPLAAVSLLAYALMAVLQIGLKISTLPVVAFGIGIGVDYGIYMFSRLRSELDRGLAFAAAYERTLSTTGASVTVTGMMLATGVSTWIVAPLQFVADMGVVLAFMIIVNMIAAMVLLPALGAWLIPPKK